MGVVVFWLLSVLGGRNFVLEPQPISIKAERHRDAWYQAKQRFIFSSAAVLFRIWSFTIKQGLGWWNDPKDSPGWDGGDSGRLVVEPIQGRSGVCFIDTVTVLFRFHLRHPDELATSFTHCSLPCGYVKSVHEAWAAGIPGLESETWGTLRFFLFILVGR
jgi:hypothetical protein